MDVQVLSLGNINEYSLPKQADANTPTSQLQKYMVLDGQALQHLEILQNDLNGKAEGSLFGFLDR